MYNNKFLKFYTFEHNWFCNLYALDQGHRRFVMLCYPWSLNYNTIFQKNLGIKGLQIWFLFKN